MTLKQITPHWDGFRLPPIPCAVTYSICIREGNVIPVLSCNEGAMTMATAEEMESSYCRQEWIVPPTHIFVTLFQDWSWHYTLGITWNNTTSRISPKMRLTPMKLWASNVNESKFCLNTSAFNEASASRVWYQHCRKWMFRVRNLHPERAIYGNVDIML